jgi:hypothetical protein
VATATCTGVIPHGSGASQDSGERASSSRARDDAALARAVLAADPDLKIRDARFDSTPLDWAQHLGHAEIAASSRSINTGCRGDPVGRPARCKARSAPVVRPRATGRYSNSWD